MILSSCPKWICKKCGKARVRIVKRDVGDPHPDIPDKRRVEGGVLKSGGKVTTSRSPLAFYKQAISTTRTTLGWTDCNCKASWKSGIVLDPFMGSGTVGKVSKRLKRNYIGIELNPDYVKMSKQRIQAQAKPLL